MRLRIVVVFLAVIGCNEQGNTPNPAAPSPTPEPVAEPEVTISNVGLRPGVWTGVWVFGTIRNTGNVEIGEGWEILARFYSSGGTLLDQQTDDSYFFTPGLRVGASEDFTINRTSAQADYFTFEVTDGDDQVIPCVGCGRRWMD